MQLLKSMLFYVLLTAWTALLATLIPFIWVFGDSSTTRRISRVWSSGIRLGLKYVVGLTYREIGIEHKIGPSAIYACNHQSVWETLIFNLLLPDVAIVLKRSLYSIPVFGWYLRNSPMIAIHRQAGTQAMLRILRAGRNAIEEGRPLLIFPEGTRQGVYAHGAFHKGIALMYRELALPLVPVAVNSGAFWAPGAMTIYGGEITVSYLKPISAGREPHEMISLLRNQIFAEKDRLVGELNLDLWLAAVG